LARDTQLEAESDSFLWRDRLEYRAALTEDAQRAVFGLLAAAALLNYWR
jgi:hypothetical protein